MAFTTARFPITSKLLTPNPSDPQGLTNYGGLYYIENSRSGLDFAAVTSGASDTPGEKEMSADLHPSSSTQDIAIARDGSYLTLRPLIKPNLHLIIVLRF